MDYISPKEASLRWSISERSIQKLCEEGRINGVVRFSKVWAIPKDTRSLIEMTVPNKPNFVLPQFQGIWKN